MVLVISLVAAFASVVFLDVVCVHALAARWGGVHVDVCARGVRAWCVRWRTRLNSNMPPSIPPEMMLTIAMPV